VNRSTIDGLDVTYFSAGEEIPTAETVDVKGYEFRNDSAAFDHPRLRRAILDIPMGASAWRFFGVVHWSDGTDLEELDREARAGSDLSPALERGIFCEIRSVQCLVCHNNHRVAVADGGNPVVTVERQRAHEFSTTCPTCGNTSFIRHAELFPDG
jgi:hypothetical protein